MGERSWEEQRAAMVEALSGNPDLGERRVLDAMRAVPRHLFIPASQRERAYDDVALPIGLAQTISQPFVVAFMTQWLEVAPGDRVLEVGTGSGYQACVLGRLCSHVVTTEILESLGLLAAARLRGMGVDTVKVVVGDGGLGYPPDAPYNAILVTAGADDVPLPLLQQLAVGGRLVAPVRHADGLVLARWVLDREGRLTREDTFGCRFVPLRGAFGRR
jgi:protein-L-isoaspartate(D-aspartate) O-methyltransferase